MKKRIIFILALLLCLPVVVKADSKPTLYDTIKSKSSGKTWQQVEDGESIISEIEEKGKKVYVYTGKKDDDRNKTDNFAVINNVCFRILRTTYQEGTKLMYYGEYKDGSCVEKQIAEPEYGSTWMRFAKPTSNPCNPNSPMAWLWSSGYGYSNSSVGYMYTLFDNPLIISDRYDSSISYANTHKNDFSSNAKTIVDNWYKDNLLDYTEWMEDDIYCNNRVPDDYHGDNDTAYDGDFDGSGFNSTTYHKDNLMDYGDISLSCSKNDSFTVKNEDGNKALTYPVGMISLDEFIYTTSIKMERDWYGSYNYVSKSWIDEYQMTMTPYRYEQTSGGEVYMFRTTLPYNERGYLGDDSGGTISPVISVKGIIEVDDGDGPQDDPYILRYPPTPDPDPTPPGEDKPEDGPQVKGDDIDLTNPKTGVFMYLWILPIIALVLYIVYVQINKKGLFKNKFKEN